MRWIWRRNPQPIDSTRLNKIPSSHPIPPLSYRHRHASKRAKCRWGWSVLGKSSASKRAKVSQGLCTLCTLCTQQFLANDSPPLFVCSLCSQHFFLHRWLMGDFARLLASDSAKSNPDLCSFARNAVTRKDKTMMMAMIYLLKRSPIIVTDAVRFCRQDDSCCIIKNQTILGDSPDRQGGRPPVPWWLCPCFFSYAKGLPTLTHGRGSRW